jgi:hypothetical protein
MKSGRSSSNPTRLAAVILSVLGGAGVGLSIRPQMPIGPARTGAVAASAVDTSKGRSWADQQLEALRAGSPAQQLDAALLLAGVKSVKDLQALLDQAHAFPKNSAGKLAVIVLLRRWLDLDPGNALQYAFQRQPAYWSGLLSSYAAAHPDEAEAYGRKLPMGRARREGLVALFEGWMTTQPERAWQLAMEPNYWIGEQIKKLAGQDIALTLAKLDQLPDAGLASQGLVAAWMEQDPDKALVWMEARPNRRELLAEAAAVFFRQDPAKAFALLASLSEKELNIVLGNMTSHKNYRSGYPGLELAQAGTGQNRKALADAVMDSPLSDEEKQNLINHFFWQDPANAQAFWNQLSANDQLIRLPSYLGRWSVLDKPAAEAWWRNLPEGPLRTAAESQWQHLETAWEPQGGDEAARLLTAIRSSNIPQQGNARMAEWTPQDLSAMAGKLKDVEPNRLGVIIRVVGQTNPESVAEWLVTEERAWPLGTEVAEFTARWALEDPVRAAAWVSRLPAGDLAGNAAINVARQYQIFDPAGAQNWAANLSEKSVRESVLKALQKDGEEGDDDE